MRKFNLQLFAAGNNNNLPVRTYQKDFKGLLQAVYKSRAHFADAWVDGLEVLDGVQNNETAFYVKTSDIPCAVRSAQDDSEAYLTDANTAFGTGTGNSTRFGPRKEIVYVDKPVNYSWGWVIHEGIDRFTVNNNFEAAVADRLELQAQKKVQLFDQRHGIALAGARAKDEELVGYNNDAVLELFDKLSAYYTDIGAVGEKVAKVGSELYNLIVNHPLTTSGKKSGANIDENEIFKFKGFIIEELSVWDLPQDEFSEGNGIGLVYIRGIGKAFTGINTTRTIESEDFDGVALQGAGKAGEYIPEDNRKAIVGIISTGA